MTNTYTVFLVGYRFNESFIYVTTRKRGCEHEEANSPYCPQCGGPMWISEQRCSDEFNELGHATSERKPGEIKLIYPSSSEDVVLFYGYYWQRKDFSCAEVPIIDFDKLKNDVDKELCALAKGGKFGAWLIQQTC